MIVSGTGTPGAVSNLAPPQIMKAQYPVSPVSPWVPVATATETDFVFGAGLGDWSGGSGTPSHEWLLGGAAVSTDGLYIRGSLDTGNLQLRVDHGGVILTTPALILPAIPQYPTGTVVDTDFGYEFLVRHAAEWAARVASANAETSIQPFYDFGVLGSTVGGWEVARTGSFPSGSIPFDVTPNTAYDLLVHVPMNYRATSTVSRQFAGGVQIRFGDSASDFRNGIIFSNDDHVGNGTTAGPNFAVGNAMADALDPGKSTDEGVLVVNGSFTTKADQTKLWVTQRMSTTSGGIGGSKMYLSRLRLREAA